MKMPWHDPDALCLLAAEAKKVYINSLDPLLSRLKWQEAVDVVATEFRDQIGMIADQKLLAEEIARSGGLMALFRNLTAPPLSQDQFKLLCPDWPKSSEKNDRPIPQARAVKIAKTLSEWFDPRIIEQVGRGDLIGAAAGPLYILAKQRFETDRRIEAASTQEQAVVELLRTMGFVQKESREIDKPWTVGENFFMKGTTFAATKQSTAEVDLAIGLPADRLLAIECKVSNDATNSIKRVNDVMKKREAWADGYGQVLTTGAVLQGVFASKDISRLAVSGVCIFFSHRLDFLENYLHLAKE